MTTQKLKTLGIIGFGKEGQAIFEHYAKDFDQVYIFDEKLESLDGIEIIKNYESKIMNEKSSFESQSGQQGIFRSAQDDISAQDDNHLLDSQKNIQLFHNLNIPASVDFLVKSPGITTHKVFLEDPNLQINSLISLLFQKIDMKKTIAVTGTKGKSTVSSLIAHILEHCGYKSELLGNIGNINLELLNNYDPDCYYVFELSSFQCQQLQNSPHIAIWTNFYIDHQDVHEDMEEYYQAKRNITRFQISQDYFITILELADVGTNATKVIISNRGSFACHGEACSGDPNPLPLPLKMTGGIFVTKLIGEHNQINCQLAFEACSKLGLEESKISEAIATFEPIKGRLEKVGEVTKNGNQIEFYTDDLATIPEATWQAVLAFENRITTLITGGSIKGSDYTKLSQNLATTNIRNIIYFEPTGSLIVQGLDRNKFNIIEAKSMKQAVDLAYHNTESGVVLLSCASASFGLFKNAHDRGEQYKSAIGELTNN
jgi:UDP-N-acetylmuramoyl-L-alanine---L-glutamate ligase